MGNRMDRAGPILRDGFLFAEIKFRWVISGEYIDLYGTGSAGVWGWREQLTGHVNDSRLALFHSVEARESSTDPHRYQTEKDPSLNSATG